MNIIANAKEIADLIKKMGDIDLYRKIVELEQEIFEVTRQRITLETRCTELEGKLAFQAKLVFRAPAYYVEGDQVPFCPQCWEASKVAIHLQRPSDGYVWICRNCDQAFSLGFR